MISTVYLTLGRKYPSALWQKVETHAQPDKVVLLLPGYLDSKDYKHLLSLGNAVATTNGVAYGLDPFGTWESGGDISQFTISSYLGQVIEVIQVLEQKHHLPCFLVGHSLGGMIAIFAAEQLPQLKGIVVMMSPHAFVRPENAERRLVQWKVEKVKYSKRDPNEKGDEKDYSVPFSFVEDSLKYDTKTILPKLTVPKLFIVGGSDDLIPEDQMVNYVAVAQEPKQLVVLPGVTHNYRFAEKQIAEVNQTVLQYMAQTQS